MGKPRKGGAVIVFVKCRVRPGWDENGFHDLSSYNATGNALSRHSQLPVARHANFGFTPIATGCKRL